MKKQYSVVNLGVVTLLLLSGALSGCEEGMSFRDWVKQTSSLKEEALKQAQVQPYRGEQYRALQLYFAQVAGVTLELSQDPKRAKQFNQALEKEDLSSVCSQVLISFQAWKEVMGRCTKNRFFLCSEETRSYPEVVSALRAKVSEKLRDRFDQTEACVQATK